MMLPKRFHDDNESIVALKRFCIHKNRENIRKHWKMSEHGMEQEGFGNIRVGKTSECRKMLEDCGKCWKHWSAERCQKTVGNIRNVRVQNRKTSEYGKHWKTLEMLETSEYGIGRHQKHRSVK